MTKTNRLLVVAALASGLFTGCDANDGDDERLRQIEQQLEDANALEDEVSGILEACEDNGIYIPRLCHLKGLTSHGSCRVCTCMVNGRAQAACTQPVAPGMVIENETERVTKIRRNLIEMLFPRLRIPL